MDILKYLDNLSKKMDNLDKPINIVDGKFVELPELNKVNYTPLGKDKHEAAKTATFQSQLLGQTIDKDISDQVSKEELMSEYLKKFAEYILKE